MKNRNALTIIVIMLIGFSLTISNGQSKSTKLYDKQMKWNFKNFEKLTFTYKQTLFTNTSLLFDSGDRPRSSTEISGLLVVEIINNGSANIGFKDIIVSNFKLDIDGSKSDVVNQKMPDMTVIEGLHEDGTVTGRYNPEFVFFSKVFFPIINKEISLGNTYSLPISVPFGVTGSTVDIKGNNSVTYISSDKELAILETIINVAEHDEPKNSGDAYVCSLKGNSAFSFNLEKGFFTQGHIDLKMAMGKKNNNQLDMDMDVKITLNLKEIK